MTAHNGNKRRRLAMIGLVVCCARAYAGNGCDIGPEAAVTVIVDMDAQTQGIQSNVTVPTGTTVINDVAVYVFDPAQQSCVWGIGYLGGIDRGIAFGHMPDAGNQGEVVGMTADLGSPVNPDNFVTISQPPGLDPGLIGPEVQYIEGGAGHAAAVPATPSDPLFTVDIMLQGAVAGDVFDFHLLDFVVVWSRGAAGAFSTQGLLSLDTGGDSVPDETQTIYGVDPDTPLPVPPAAYPVDYIDGPAEGGPATITIVGCGDVNGDGLVNVLDLIEVLLCFGQPATPPCDTGQDVNGDGVTNVLDLIELLLVFGTSCP